MEPVIIRKYCNHPCTTCSPYTLLIRRLETSLLLQLALDTPFPYVPAALMSDVTRVTSIPGAIALIYIIFLWTVLYLDILFSHHVYFQQPGNLKKHTRHHV
jgi:hypothetical protein